MFSSHKAISIHRRERLIHTLSHFTHEATEIHRSKVNRQI